METQFNLTYLTKELLNRIFPYFDPERIIIFGSYVNGNPTYDSDLDILFEFIKIENKRKLILEIRNKLNDFPIPKDVVILTKAEVPQYREMKWSAYCKALEEGKVIYEKN